MRPTGRQAFLPLRPLACRVKVEVYRKEAQPGGRLFLECPVTYDGARSPVRGWQGWRGQARLIEIQRI